MAKFRLDMITLTVSKDRICLFVENKRNYFEPPVKQSSRFPAKLRRSLLNGSTVVVILRINLARKFRQSGDVL